MTANPDGAGQSAGAAAARIVHWLAAAALPLWRAAGQDADGGFYEALDLQGRALGLPRRARVAPRQIYVFCHGRELGWHGEFASVVRNGIANIETRFRRPDGFYRTRVAASGEVLDDTALLYDQAFVLLGLAAAAGASGDAARCEESARDLRDAIARNWRTAPGEFQSGDAGGDLREANPHMHLLEACLAWTEISTDPQWRIWSADLVQTALDRFIDPANGVLFEIYDADWRRVDDGRAHSVEPGHLYEWFWLLMRARPADLRVRAAARRLIETAEAHGVHGGIAVNGLDSQLAVRDPNGRLWVQTERLRACTVASRLTGEPRFGRAAEQAAQVIEPYLRTPVPGLWFDERTPEGEHHAPVVHASTLYHLVSAARELA